MATTTDEIIAQLVADAVGTAATDLFADVMPDAPNTCVAVIEYPGRPSEFAFGSARVKWEFPRIQFSARGEPGDAVAPRVKLNAVRNSIVKMANATVLGTKYLRVQPLQAPFPNGRDANECYTFAFNAEFQREVPAGE